MLLEKLPLELVQNILALVLQNDELRNLVALLGVSKVLEAVTTKLYLRKIRDLRPAAAYWTHVPFAIRRRMARDAIMTEPGVGSKRNIATYMHAVADHLMRYAREHCMTGAGAFNRAHWLHEIASVLAPSEADCLCGNPAFLHSKCYGLSSVPYTAFHIAIIRRHTLLEVAMIADGMGGQSVCPYLKVSKKDPTRTRRNALEWACAHQLEATVHRLVAVAEKSSKKPEDYLPTATAVCAVTMNQNESVSLLRFLLDRLSILSWNRSSAGPLFTYQSRVISFKDWNRIVLANLARRNTHEARVPIYEMREHYPYLEFGNTLNLLPANYCLERFGYSTITRQRPFCQISNADNYMMLTLIDSPDREAYIDTSGHVAEWMRHWHLVTCSSEACLHRYNKAHPICKRCRKRHAFDPDGFDDYDWNGVPRWAKSMENVVGRRPDSIERYLKVCGM